MSKEIYISSTPHETRLAIVENDDLTEIYYERENEYTLAGSIYNGKVTRVLPGMQSSFVDVGLERDAFLYITDFMEEAGDSADFDSAEGGGGRGRGDRSRAPRDGVASEPVTANGSGEAAAEPAAREERRGRDDRGGRGDRNDRRRRNGSRDEAGRAPRSQTPEPISTTYSPAEPQLRSEASDEQAAGTPDAAGTGGDLGEGAPGADGSRRWRGRRGRRRGRGSSTREEGASSTGDSSADDASPETASAGAAGLNSPEFDNSDVETMLELGAAAEDRAAASAYGDPNSASLETVSAGEELAADDPYIPGSRVPREQTGGRDRNRRGGRDRGDRDSRGSREPRAFAADRSAYDTDDDQGAASSAEPIVLPGEQLAKYRPGGDTAAAAPAASSTSTAAAPSSRPDFTLPGAWDGGAVLPGETLRPRSRPAESGRGESSREDRSAGRHEERSAGSSDRGPRRDGRDRDRRGSRPDRPPFSDRSRPGDRTPSPAASGADRTDQSSRTTSPPPLAYLRAEPGAPASAPLDSAPVTAEPSGTLAAAYTPEPHATSEPIRPLDFDAIPVPPAPSADPFPSPEPIEYEPTEASASHRFDPAPPREYRQSAAAVEAAPGEEVEESPTREQDAVPRDPNAGTTFEAETAPPAGANTHLITPAVGAPLHPLVFDAPDSVPAPTAEPELPTHEFTAIASDGEMRSEQPTPQPQDTPEPASPIRHETALLDEDQHTVQPAAPAPLLSRAEFAGAPADAAYGPGADHAADPAEPVTLNASAIEEIDYDEEETLEGAADLGTMIREMSIDEITHTGADEDEDAAYDEEMDFEEQDALEQDESHAAEDEVLPGRQPFSEDATDDEDEPLAASDHATDADGARSAEPRDRDADHRRTGRRDGRRDGRRSSRSDDRARSTGGSDDRNARSSGMRSGGRRDHRHSAQTTNLPAISDLLKPGQEVLVQIAKEPIAKKGARITSHIALPGRFLVFMPTVNHTGVSRKIESDGERRRLKEILLSEKGEASGGFIVRTAAANASEEELRSDLRFLLNLWADIKQRSESSKSPALIYHDLNLVERILRDQVTDTFSAIWVDTETEYERVLRFLQRFQPSLIRRVKLYTKETPLFEQFGLTEEINKALRSKVWLKSGGSIVINQTEALVAIDINTGKYVGKTARLEDTIVKTNLDAIPEIVRQIRLRDLGGIIIIDFIDMDERKNRNRVMAALEDELKKDRAPSKVLQFNDFGLVAITRKRVKQSLERTLSTTCGVCAGTGMVKSPVTVCNDIYIEMKKMQKHLDRGDVMLRVNPEVVKQLKSPTARWLQEMEEMVGKTILVKSDPTLHPEQFDIH